MSSYAKSSVSSRKSSNDQKSSPTKAVKKGIIKESSQICAPVDKPEITKGPPPFQLQIHHVFGYHAKEQRRNIHYLSTNTENNDSDLICYTAGAFGIVHQKSSNSQTILQGHDDDVLGIALHPKQRLMATGQVGRDAYILIHQIQETKMQLPPKANLVKTLKVPRGSNGVSCLQFNHSGELLFALTRHEQNEVLVFDVQQEKLLTSHRISSKVLDMIIHPSENKLCLVGVKYIGFASFNTKLEVKRGEFGNTDLITTMTSALFLEDSVIAGTTNGYIYTWKEGKLANKAGPFVSSIFSLATQRDMIIVGGKDQLITINKAMDVMHSLEVSHPVCAIDTTDKKILYGMRHGTIVEYETKTHELVRGHNALQDAELWGLDVKQQVVASVNDHGCHLYHITDRKFLTFIECPAARCVGWHPKQNKLVVGCLNGTVYVFEGDDTLTHWTLLNKMTVTTTKVSVVKYAHNGKYLVCGAQDGKLDVFDALNNHARLGEMSGHSARILAFDYSTDGNFLISNSSDKETLYWDIGELKQLTNKETIRELKWHSFETMFNWYNMGIWQQQGKKQVGKQRQVQDASDINCVAVHGDKKLLVCGTDATTVQMWSWPRPRTKEPSAYKEFKGHCSHVTNVKWTANGDYVVSTGGMDNCVMVWKVEQE